MVLRPATWGGVELVLIHRPAYDDWTLPKGKLNPGETHEAAALREVREETGMTCRLVRPAGQVRYTDRHGRGRRSSPTARWTGCAGCRRSRRPAS